MASSMLSEASQREYEENVAEVMMWCRCSGTAGTWVHVYVRCVQYLQHCGKKERMATRAQHVPERRWLTLGAQKTPPKHTSKG